MTTFLAQSSNITINDAAQNTSYSISPSTTTATEGNQVTFTVTRSGITPSETIYFSALTGTASYSAGDYAMSNGASPANIAVNFGSGVTSQTVTMNMLSDGVSDSSETFKTIVQRNTSDPVTTFLAQSSNITINDAAQNTSYSISPSTTTATEGNQVTFTVTRSGNHVARDGHFSTRADGSATWSEAISARPRAASR